MDWHWLRVDKWLRRLRRKTDQKHSLSVAQEQGVANVRTAQSLKDSEVTSSISESAGQSAGGLNEQGGDDRHQKTVIWFVQRGLMGSSSSQRS